MRINRVHIRNKTMTLKYSLILATLTFILGYYFSEYRHSLNKPAEHTQSSLLNSTPAAPTLETPLTTKSFEPVSNNVQQTSLEKIQELIANNSYPSAIQLLNSELKKNPADTQALLLLARLLEQQGQHQDAIGIWFRYIAAETDAKKIDDAIGYLSNYLLRLADNPMIFGESRDWLISQLNDLIKLTPDTGELHLQLAEIYSEKADTEQVQYHALMAANQTETRSRAEAILAKLTEKTVMAQTENEISIPLTRFGNQFLVPIQVDGQSIKLLLDTGASISGLTSNFLQQHPAMIKSQKPIQLNTASGTIDSFLFVVDSFTLDKITFNKHMLANLPMENFDHFDGLLGIDILGKFDFVIDQNNAVLHLRKRQ